MQHHDLSDVRGHTNDDAIKAFNLSHEEPLRLGSKGTQIHN